MLRLPLVLLTLAACDSATTMMNTVSDLSMNMVADLTTAPGADLAMKADMATVAGGIPDPGSGGMVDNNFGDMEPNDTPGQATPLGTSAQANVYLWVSSNSGGGSDTAEYFVFKTGPTSTMFTLSGSGLCWSGAITGIDATLWKVVAGQEVLPPVQTWMSTTSCTPPGSPATVEPSSEYLLGLTIHGSAGMYFA